MKKKKKTLPRIEPRTITQKGIQPIHRRLHPSQVVLSTHLEQPPARPLNPFDNGIYNYHIYLFHSQLSLRVTQQRRLLQASINPKEPGIHYRADRAEIGII